MQRFCDDLIVGNESTAYKNEMPEGLSDAFLISAFFLVVSFTFYLADPDDHELTTPTGSEDNTISFVHSDVSETQFSGMEPEDELGTLTVSDVTSDGFDLSWNLKYPSVFERFAVEYKDSLHLWDVREVQFPGDVTGSRIQGLKAHTEYQVTLYGITTSQRSALLEAVAVTGIKLSLEMHVFTRVIQTVFPVVELTLLLWLL